MRHVLIGGTPLSVATARHLLDRGDEVVIIEKDEAVIDSLRELLDCGFLAGDGSRPRVLRDAGPENTDVLFCLTDSDQTNILAGLLGRTLGFQRVVPKIDDPDYEEMCLELGLTDTIIPDRETGHVLAELAVGGQPLEISALLKENVRFFSFTADANASGPVADLDLPQGVRVMTITRGGKSLLCEGETKIEPGDQILLLAYEERLKALKDSYGPRSDD